MEIKAYSNCEFGIWFEDTSVGIFGGWECDNPDITEEEYEKTYEWSEGSNDCPYFKSGAERRK
jgi:hypothetical protein